MNENHVHVAARVTLGVIPNLFMLLVLFMVGFYFWGQYRINLKLALEQSAAIDAAIVEGREFHHRQGRLLRLMAAKVGIDQRQIDEILPENTLVTPKQVALKPFKIAIFPF